MSVFPQCRWIGIIILKILKNFKTIQGGRMNTQLTVKDLQHQAWAVKIQEQIKSGLTVSTWCSQNGMNTKTFYYRRKQLRGELIDSVPTSRLKPLSFTELVPPAEPDRQCPDSSFEAQLTIDVNGAVISVNQNTPRQLLIDVMNAVRHA